MHLAAHGLGSQVSAEDGQAPCEHVDGKARPAGKDADQMGGAAPQAGGTAVEREVELHQRGPREPWWRRWRTSAGSRRARSGGLITTVMCGR